MKQYFLSEYTLYTLIFPTRFNKIFIIGKKLFLNYYDNYRYFNICRFLLENILILRFIFIILLQLSISSFPEGIKFFNNLPSLKYIKKKFISSFIGKSAIACLIIFVLLEKKKIRLKEMYLKDFFILINDLLEIINFNSIANKQKNEINFNKYIKLFMYSFCQKVNNFFLTKDMYLNNNLNFIKDLGLVETINFIQLDMEFYGKFEINIDSIIEKIQQIYLSNELGQPIQHLFYTESTKIFSKLESEILDGKFIRSL
uniref:Uncharacterized protein n=1 Tax=Phacus orbicularis TaxID=158829 RepID=A0A182B0X6_9EUGL|nr:hypothetical protein [Phacus orbicularis]